MVSVQRTWFDRVEISPDGDDRKYFVVRKNNEGEWVAVQY